MRVALDAEGEPLRLALEAGPEIVKVNAAEAAGLLGEPAGTREEALAASAQLRELAGGGGHAGIVTRGADGVTVAAPDGARYEGVLYERGRYPVGSGDAFLAGLVVGLERGDPLPGALGLALGAAAANAELPGAGALDAAQGEVARGASRDPRALSATAQDPRSSSSAVGPSLLDDVALPPLQLDRLPERRRRLRGTTGEPEDLGLAHERVRVELEVVGPRGQTHRLVRDRHGLLEPAAPRQHLRASAGSPGPGRRRRPRS